MEHLGISLRVLFIVDKEIAGDHDNHISIGGTGLSIQSSDSMGDFLEWKGCQFLDNCLSSLQLRRLERQHRMFSLLSISSHTRIKATYVEISKLRTIRIELLIVKSGELFYC
jgi:hypothetical protein